MTAIAVTGAAVAVIVLLAAWLSSAAGKRLAVLFAVLAYPAVVQVLLQYVLTPLERLNWLYAGLTAALEVLIVCAPAVVINRAWRRPRPLGSSSGEGLA